MYAYEFNRFIYLLLLILTISFTLDLGFRHIPDLEQWTVLTAPNAIASINCITYSLTLTNCCACVCMARTLAQHLVKLKIIGEPIQRRYGIGRY